MKSTDLFPARLRAERERQGLSQADLAKCAGFQASSVSHFETGGRSPSLENFIRIVAALGVSADSLLGTVPPRTGHPVNRERRERIATVALQGLLANSDGGPNACCFAWDAKGAAAYAIEHADALIAELDKKEADGG